MRFRTLIVHGLRFHWRAHLGVALGATVAAAVLVGALAVGDSVRYSLRAMALARLGWTEVALAAPDRFFRDHLADRVDAMLFPWGMMSDLQGRWMMGPTCSLLMVSGSAVRQDGSARVGQVQVLGIDRNFTRPAEITRSGGTHFEDGVDVNERTARALRLKVGDRLLVRVGKPSALPPEAPLGSTADSALAMRLTVQAIVSDAEVGRFSLQANQVPPHNIFLPLWRLQKELSLEGQVNVMLVGNGPDTILLPDWVVKSFGFARWAELLFGRKEERPRVTVAQADEVLAKCWRLADAELELRQLPEPRGIELFSRRVFLDPPVGSAAAAEPGAVGVLTYLVNELRVGDRATPYSMVTAVGPLAVGEKKGAAPVSGSSETGAVPFFSPGEPGPAKGTVPFSQQREKGTAPFAAVLPPGMADDECVINTWLAEDLAAKPGDSLDMTYYVMGPRNRLETRSARFRIRAVVPIEGAAADRTLMPDFPGLADVENCRDWKPGAPVDLKKIRKKDEAYWNQYRGMPKAFVTLAAGQKMWANRFGSLTAVRFPAAGGDSAESLGERLRSRLNPRDFGLYFLPVRERALAAAESATDFGGLFLGLSFFLVAAALVLMGLLFALQVEQRTEETGTLLALGLPQRQVRRLYLAEGAALALVGAVLGSAAGLLYTRVVLWGLATVWQGAVGAADLRFHAAPLTVAGGAAAGFLVALAAIWLTVRRQARAPARELLAAGAEAELRPAGGRRAGPLPGLLVAAAGGAAAGLILPLARSATGEQAAGAFFGVGALALVAGLGLCHALLAALARGSARSRLDLAGLALRNAARRRGRSLATVALLACGVFLVIAVDTFHLGPGRDTLLRPSGTGGFALYGETSLPVVEDLNTAEGRRAFALPAWLKDEVKVVPLRVHEGDDASCLNLNRPQQPRIVGVQPEELAARGAFSFAETLGGQAAQNPWLLLAPRPGDGAVPAIADQTTITWALKMKVGDTLDYTDERGRTFRIRLVGALANSILQGCLILSDQDFIEKFPSEGGYRVFLIDAPPERAAEAAKALSRQMSDAGMAVSTAGDRLAAFGAVQNTYLAIFQALGGLGLVLGSIGLGIVVLRNVLERRGELAVLRAVGFTRRCLDRLVLREHWLLLALGLAVGTVAAMVAVLPALRSSGADVPYVFLAATLAAVFASGLLWTWLAARMAMRGPLLEALRNE